MLIGLAADPLKKRAAGGELGRVSRLIDGFLNLIYVSENFAFSGVTEPFEPS